jgi:DNA-binding beta-propeller fold protein YncE
MTPRMNKWRFALFSAAFLALAGAGTTAASTGSLRYQGCIGNGGASGCGAPTHQSLNGPGDVAVSPDGTSVYVASYPANSISRFKREPDGSLRYLGCLANGTVEGCRRAKHRSLWFPRSVAVSPDSKSVYVAAGSSITRFQRRQGGRLRYAGCFANDGAHGCRNPSHDSLGGATDLAVSPDGRSLYVSALGSINHPDGVLTRFKLRANGGLRYRGCFANGGSHGCKKPSHASLLGAYGVAVSPDGKSVYLTSFYANSLSVFKRAASGGLAYAGCLANRGAHGCTTAPHRSLAAATDVVVSPDDTSVYVSARGTNSITTFRRSSPSALDFKGCISNRRANGCRRPTHNSLDDPAGLAMSDDGRSLYVASFGSNSITWFSRSSASTLRYRGCVADGGASGCVPALHDSLRRVVGVATSPDGRSLYSAAVTADAVTSFRRDAGP